MTCRECPKDVDDLFHDLCRGHSYCARGFQYYGAPCVVCEELWDRAKNLDAPDDAVVAFKVLKRWIVGFRKNSRHRPKGVGYFYSQDEREAFQELNAIHHNLTDISSDDSSLSKSQVRRGSSFIQFSSDE